MKKEKWTLWDKLQHQLIHLIYDLLVLFHDWLIQYACDRNLWRTPEQRASEQPPPEQT